MKTKAQTLPQLLATKNVCVVCRHIESQLNGNYTGTRKQLEKRTELREFFDARADSYEKGLFPMNEVFVVLSGQDPQMYKPMINRIQETIDLFDVEIR